MQNVAWPSTMVQIEKSIPMMSKAERSEMPVMMPGSAIGSTNSSEIVSRPKNLARDRAAAASVPKMRARTVAMAATLSESQSGGQMSGRSNHATANHLVVSP